MTKNAYPKRFHPENPKKWIGCQMMTARSEWEWRFMKWADRNPLVVQVSSESTVVRYFNPMTKKMSNYYLDFKMDYNYPDKGLKSIIIEIKPYNQTIQPTPSKNSKGLIIPKALISYNNQLQTYLINVAKWTAAKMFAEKNNYAFWILTEKELFNA